MNTHDFTGHERGSRSYRRVLIGLFFAGVATFAQLYAPQAVLPFIAADLDVSPATAALAVSAATLGLTLAVIPWSLVADRLGRIPAMATGIIAATLFGGLAPAVGDVWLLLGMRFLEGVALGAVPAVALVYLSEEVDRRFTAAAAGGYIAGTTVGGLSGRLLAGPIADAVGWRPGVWATTLLCAVSAALFLWLVPRARGFRPVASWRGIRSRLLAPLRSPQQVALFTMGFLLMGAFVAVYNYLGFHLTAPPFLLPAWLVTMLFLAYLAGTASSPWAGSLASRFGRYRVLLASIGVTIIGALLLLTPSVWLILLGLVVFTAGFFGAHTVASGWAPAMATPDTRAQASSLYYFAYYGGSSLFGWALGIVFGDVGWVWFLAGIIAMCTVAAVLAACVLPRDSRPAAD